MLSNAVFVAKDRRPAIRINARQIKKTINDLKLICNMERSLPSPNILRIVSYMIKDLEVQLTYTKYMPGLKPHMFCIYFTNYAFENYWFWYAF